VSPPFSGFTFFNFFSLVLRFFYYLFFFQDALYNIIYHNASIFDNFFSLCDNELLCSYMHFMLICFLDISSCSIIIFATHEFLYYVIQFNFILISFLLKNYIKKAQKRKCTFIEKDFYKKDHSLFYMFFTNVHLTFLLLIIRNLIF